MAYNYEYTELAVQDIDDALNYICNNLKNYKAAYDLLTEIDTTINKICVFPKAYPDCKYYYIKDDNIRHAAVNNYVLVFKICKETILILRFKHSKQSKLL